MDLRVKYKQLENLENEWFSKLKKIFISSRDYVWNVIIITKDNNVFAYGRTVWAIIGLYKPKDIQEPTIIPELCGKDLMKVVFGDRFMVSLTESNEVYTGGWCKDGRCGNGINKGSYCKPTKISIGDVVVIDIDCCESHTFLMTNSQEIYTFGALSSFG